MRTIIISAKEHLDWIFEYRQFFEPFFKDADIEFCEWRKEGKTIDSTLPDIYEKIAGERNWRAVVLCDDLENGNSLNPFDVVHEKSSAVENADSLSEDENPQEALMRFEKELNERINNKKAAYDEASKKPLVRLCTYLCPLPLDGVMDESELSDGSKKPITTMDVRDVELDREMKAYRSTASYKEKLRAQIKGREKFRANLPLDVFCISFRTIQDERLSDSTKLGLAWRQHSNVRYSDFCDRNMYFEKMRFFTYDILPEDHVNYKFNFMEFIYTLLIFAQNSLPGGATQPGRLYSLESTCSEEKLKKIIRKYDQKLENTVSKIEAKVAEIEKEIPRKLTDIEAENAFHTRNTIPVQLDPSFDMEGYYAEEGGFGLSTDCPKNEESVWNGMYSKSNKVLGRFLKQPRRSLEKSVEELQKNNTDDSVQVLGLNHFQLEDIEEFVGNEESKMIAIHTPDLYNNDRYETRAKKSSDEVKKVIATRMTKDITILLGVIVLGVFLISFVPVLFFNDEALEAAIPLLLSGISIGILFIVGVVTLFYLRSKLNKAVKDYNATMNGIRSEISAAMGKLSQVLSHACHIMKGNYVLTAAKKNDNVFKQRARVLTGHIAQIKDKQIELRTLFGDYVNEHPQPDLTGSFEYDFTQQEEYSYPITFGKSDGVNIPYIEEGVRAYAPFDFIESITLRMEELYE